MGKGEGGEIGGEGCWILFGKFRRMRVNGIMVLRGYWVGKGRGIDVGFWSFGAGGIGGIRNIIFMDVFRQRKYYEGEGEVGIHLSRRWGGGGGSVKHFKSCHSDREREREEKRARKKSNVRKKN